MGTRRWSVYAVTLHLALVGLALSTAFLAVETKSLRAELLGPVPTSPMEVGQVAQPLALVDAAGEEVRLDTTDGRAERLLFFFTTTCPSCKENQGSWRELYRSVGRRAEVVGVSLDPAVETARYAKSQQLPFPVFTLGNAQAFDQSYRLELVPFTLHLDSEGRVRDSWIGLLTDHDIERIVSSALAAAGG